METKIVYQYDDSGWYLNEVELNETDKSPLEEDVWLLPRNCTEKKPPKSRSKKKFPNWSGTKWVLKEIPQEEEQKEEETQEDFDPIEQRREAYKEADALKNEIEFDAMVAGKLPDYQPWFDLVKSIKERFPK